MTGEAFIAFVQKNSALAALCLEHAKEARDKRDKAALYAHLKEFVRLKFLLDSSEREDDLMALAIMSTGRIIELTEGNTAFLDKSAGCTSADTPTVKKILLLFTIRDAFNIPLNFEKSPDIATISDLADEILRLS